MKLDYRFLNISFVVQGVANSPAANPVAGTQYIVGSTPTDDFASATANSIAYYDGTAWSFTAPVAGNPEVLNAATGEILRYNGSAWVVVASISATPIDVLYIAATGTTLPNSPNNNDQFFNTSDSKIYNAYEGTWNNGSALNADGVRIASKTDFKIYECINGEFVARDIPEYGLIYKKDERRLYVYNAQQHQIIRADGGKFVRKDITLTANAIEYHAVDVANPYLLSGEDDSLQVFVSGLLQMPGVDYTYESQAIVWTGKTLENILKVGDVITCYYIARI